MSKEANRLPPDERYRRDATFAALVDTLEHMIRAADYTPTEIREAAMLAAIRCDQWREYRIMIGASPEPPCTCKNRTRQHESGCWWFMRREEDALRARVAIMPFDRKRVDDEIRKAFDTDTDTGFEMRRVNEIIGKAFDAENRVEDDKHEC